MIVSKITKFQTKNILLCFLFVTENEEKKYDDNLKILDENKFQNYSEWRKQILAKAYKQLDEINELKN